MPLRDYPALPVVGKDSFIEQVARLRSDDQRVVSSLEVKTANISAASIGKMGFFTAPPIAQPAALTAALTSITYTSPVTPDYAIADLTNSSPYGFVSADEGRTVLSVISNLQTRVNELETKLQALGLIA